MTPSKAGHVFTPGSRSYSITQADIAAQDYAAAQTWQVSGTVTAGVAALAGVTLTGTNGASCTPSNGSGQYACTVPHNWSGSVSASMSGHTFAPASRNYTGVTANQGAGDFAATSIKEVSGTVSLNGVPLANVALSATNGGTCLLSNALGQYLCIVPTGWSGDITPAATGYTFTPALRNYTNVTTAQTAQTFAAGLDTGSETIHFIHVDHLNTPRLLANQSQQPVWRWEQFEPFGVNPPDENPSSLGAFEFNLRFPGQYADRETNLYYNYSRDYDAEIGRYIESDRIGIVGGINTYAYVDGDPLVWFDDDGAAKKKYQKPANPNRRKGAETRQQTGERERNVKHPGGEEHSRRPKGGFRARFCIPLTIWEIAQEYCVENPGAPECLFINPPPDPDDPCKGDPDCA